jgi:AraC-like DNA-binding protein
MTYKSFLPRPALKEFVRNYTIIDFQFNPHEPIPFKQRSPKTEQKIVFYIKEPPIIHNSATGHRDTPPLVSIFSHQMEKRTFEMRSEFRALIIYLQPGALHNLIRLPMIELQNKICDAEFFFGGEVRAVHEQLASATGQSEMILVVEQFLLPKFTRTSVKSSIDRIALHIMVDPACFSLDTIAQQACLGTKQFYRRFTERIGIGPKLFSRLSRFNHAYQYKIKHPLTSWSSIAQEFRYTDYHHMEKEFKEFTSLTPEQWTRTHLTAPERILKLR